MLAATLPDAVRQVRAPGRPHAVGCRSPHPHDPDRPDLMDDPSNRQVEHRVLQPPREGPVVVIPAPPAPDQPDLAGPVMIFERTRSPSRGEPHLRT